jgi:hypothetical protein
MKTILTILLNKLEKSKTETVFVISLQKQLRVAGGPGIQSIHTDGFWNNDGKDG